MRYVKKRRRYSSYRGEVSNAPPNLVKRNFHAEAPGLLWLTDISWFPADDGKIYFSALVDCFDGKIVGATTSRHPNQRLANERKQFMNMLASITNIEASLSSMD
ncbi:hypothetical protein FRC0355_02055 [Corynebacterium diphtheriae]|nr:hypothetical protein FRC0355_02055 [Corynebacterium diphtheriae]